MKPENTVDKFFEDLPSEDKQLADVFANDNANPATPVPGKDDEPHKNRRHRRLEQQLQDERDARIRAEALLEGRTESQKFTADVAEVPDKWLRIYGDTPESRTAWQLNKELFDDYAAQARKGAIEEIEQRSVEATKQQKQFESFIDKELEEIEDQYNVDVTSDAPAARKARREFLEMVQSLSPKGEDGTITDYADFGATWEQYQSSREKRDTSRQKNIADRSMERSGSSAQQEKQPTPGFRGWMRDYNI